MPAVAPLPAHLAVEVSGSNARDFDLEDLLHRVLDLLLGCTSGYLKRQGMKVILDERALLGYDRSLENVVS